MLKYILGIETSCDETAASVVTPTNKVISNIIFSQQKLHSPYFGVVPELASRTHYEKIDVVLEKAMKGINAKDISLISYTKEPGLKGALAIGEVAAKALGYIYKIPTIGVDHLWGHISSVFISHNKIKFPFISLVISGGHTQLSLVYSTTDRKILGNTRDDAVGEAFDKVAKILNLTYPGGPAIEKLAKKGNKNAVFFKRPYIRESWDFSFSGIKTAVLYYVNSLRQKKIKISKQLVCDICASFQEAICDTIATKLFAASEKFNCKRVAVSGGVSANSYLRQYLIDMLGRRNVKLFFPAKLFTTDNAAMIAVAGKNFYLYRS